MPKFGDASVKKLNSCHIDLQTIFNQVIKYIDCTILEGHRDEEAQNKAFADGNSQLKWPDGKHNKLPSIAVDVSPYPVDFNDRERITLFAGYVLGTAEALRLNGSISHKVRWGGDWNMNYQVSDNKFDDLVHFELI